MSGPTHHSSGPSKSCAFCRPLNSNVSAQNPMELHEQLETVTDATTFLAFVRALIKDREAEAGRTIDDFGRGENGWENHTIEGFLEAALSWAESTNLGASQGLVDASPWKRFAVFLYCGKIYE